MQGLLFIVLGFLLVLSPQAMAQDAVTLAADFESVALGPHLAVAEDAEGHLTLADILQKSEAFQPAFSSIPLYSFSKSAYWFRFELQNREDKDRPLYLQIGCSWLDSMVLYTPQEQGGWSQEHMGDMHPYSERKIQSILPTFSVQVPAGSRLTYYLRVQTSDAFIMPIFLRSEVAHYAHERRKEYLSGVLFGLIGVMFVFNLIVYVFSRDRAYLIYSINLLAWFFLFFTLDGYAFAWLWPQSDWWTNRAYVLSIAMSTIWGTLFAKEFLKTREIVPHIDASLNIWLGSQILLALGVFVLPYDWVIVIACVCTVIFCILVPIVALAVLRRGFHPALYYISSWIFPSFAAFYYLAVIFGFIAATGINIHILHVGIAMEVIMLSVALGDRMRQLTQEKKDLQQGLEVARVVQESFLFKDIRSPRVCADFIYRPSDALGGDWFACMEREDQGKLFICLGDVTGHGIATSLITGSAAGSFQTAVMALAPELSLEAAAESLARQLNDTILRIGTRQNAMMTATLLVIDLRSLEGIYLNAGHVNIFIKSHESVHAQIRRGSILGLSSSPKFSPVHLHLKDGDIIILYSDGLVENQNTENPPLNPKRLTKLIEASPDLQTLKSGILELAEKNFSNSHHQDDATVLMIQLLDKTAS